MPRPKKDNLTREVLEQLIGDPNDDGMPVILAKRLDPQIPTTNNLRDYGFEGLSRVERGGSIQWEPNKNFVLIIEGDTGNCRIPDTERLAREIGAWEQKRNEGGTTVDWRFTAPDAREKLARLYPAQS